MHCSGPMHDLASSSEPAGRDPSYPAAVLNPIGQAWTLDMAWLSQGVLVAQDDGSLQHLSLVGASTQVLQCALVCV